MDDPIGFMVMAFKEEDDSKPLGSFLTPTDPQAKTMDCPGIFLQVHKCVNLACYNN